MSNFNVPSKVLLPESIFNQAKDTEQLKQLVLQYMKRYPDYRVTKIKDGFAICERR